MFNSRSSAKKTYSLLFKRVAAVFILLIPGTLFSQEDADPYDVDYQFSNLDSNQTNFSKEYLIYLSGSTSTTPDVPESLKALDYSAIWIESTSQDGVIGKDYQRIRIKFLDIQKDHKEALTYRVKGKSNLRNTICRFEGSIHLIHAFLDSLDDQTVSNFGNLIASYEFHEDSTQVHPGIFKGILESRFYLDSSDIQTSPTLSVITTDDYSNNTFVGSWKPYKGGREKKCIWGDGLLPYVFDFDLGTNEIVVNPRYKNNGWQTFGEFDKEYIEKADGSVMERNAWWKEKKK
jgi:hypothetical protein